MKPMPWRLMDAGIPRRYEEKTLDTFSGQPAIVTAAQAYIDSYRPLGPGLMLSGPTGCGKSHIAIAILRAVITAGNTGLYRNVPALLASMRATFSREDESEEDVMNEVCETGLLVLDDLGADRPSDYVVDRLYLILHRRYESLYPTIITTNLSEDEIIARFGARTLSRINEMCGSLGDFPAQDYRRTPLHGSLP